MERKYSEALCELTASTRHAGELASVSVRSCRDLVHSE